MHKCQAPIGYSDFRPDTAQKEEAKEPLPDSKSYMAHTEHVFLSHKPQSSVVESWPEEGTGTPCNLLLAKPYSRVKGNQTCGGDA